MSQQSSFNMVSENNQSTVVAEYTPSERLAKDFQSEASLENEFVELLQQQGYQKVCITNREQLESNLRVQIEKLNNIKLSEKEWNSFFQNVVACKNEGIVDKTRKIQVDHVQNLTLDNGTTKNIKLIDKKDIHNNTLQVINQFEENDGNHKTRYDVTVLVNGLPLVHIELKRRGVAIREAFNQIKRYQRDSFWASSGLFEYVQIFVISNGTETKYYSNTTRESHINESGNQKAKSKKTSNSFEFTSFWADANNSKIADLVDFSKTFFAKHTILNVLTKYCIFTVQDILMVMRPYQICATERIISKIETSNSYKKMGTVDAGGYVWHTTGSGKTLTSFKTAQLATKLDYIDKVLFVVDRKDLDKQTIKEYNRFQENCANQTTSTRELTKQLHDKDVKIIVTTIQKLTRFIANNKKNGVFAEHVVIIFDECHRSQFGDMHTSIEDAFKNYHLFGFTGTPIFGKNSIGKKESIGGKVSVGFKVTTEKVFGKQLHTYTIVDAINDGNVLPFKLDYVSTMKMSENVQDEQITGINCEKALSSPDRISEIVSYILEHFDQKTMRNHCYSLNGKRANGFNSLFAVSSIDMAKKYYVEFQKQLKEKNSGLKIATIFSYCPNEEDPQDGTLDASFDTESLDKSSRDFLDGAIDDYNKMFNTNYSTDEKEFDGYYTSLTEKLKNREIDLVIVVNMFLTGFDATTLNTLWVDKNLKYHGLIQAFSRTNRILNSVKTFGNIVCFRDLEQATNDAIALFGNKLAQGIVRLKNFEAYYFGYDEDEKHHKGYVELVDELKEVYPLDEEIVGEYNEKQFIKLYGQILKMKSLLSTFDKFEGKQLLSERDFQDYQSNYISIYESMKKVRKNDKKDINDDIVFEIELIKQVEINIDYILMMVAKYFESNCKDIDMLDGINKAISSSLKLRSKKDLINQFISSMSASTNVEEDWVAFVTDQKEKELENFIKNENLNELETKKFIKNCFRDGQLKTIGTDIDKILPPMSRFGGGRAEKKQSVIDKLLEFFEKYFGIGAN